MSHHYENQPRVPKGHEDGGQWTRYGSSPRGILEAAAHEARIREVVNQLRAQAILPDAFRRKPAPIDPEVVRQLRGRAVQAGLALYTWLSSLNTREQRAVITFRAREYQVLEGRTLDMESVKVLDRDEVNKICRELKTVQRETDKAAEKLLPYRPYMRPADYGTIVHSRVEKAINVDPPWKRNNPKDPDFRAELSIVKSAEEVPGAASELRNPKTGLLYTAEEAPADKVKRSIRVDVYENVGNGTICVYDIKTGGAVLGFNRMLEIARNVAAKYDFAKRIVVTQVKPTH